MTRSFRQLLRAPVAWLPAGAEFIRGALLLGTSALVCESRVGVFPLWRGDSAGAHCQFSRGGLALALSLLPVSMRVTLQPRRGGRAQPLLPASRPWRVSRLAAGPRAVGTHCAVAARALLPARCRCLDRPQSTGWALGLRVGIRFSSSRLGRPCCPSVMRRPFVHRGVRP